MATTPTSKDPILSRDATVALALARTSLPFAATRAEEAERWLRVLRVHGQVGVALQALGVGEASLEAASNGHDPGGRRHEGRRPDETVTDVCRRALELADCTGADTVGTIHLLSAVLRRVRGDLRRRALPARDLPRRGLGETGPRAGARRGQGLIGVAQDGA